VDYLAFAVARFFDRQDRKDSHRVKRLPKTLANAEPRDARDRILARLSECESELGLSGAEGTAPRDQTAHSSPVEAGVFNVRRARDSEAIEVTLVGGGENLPVWIKEVDDPADEPTLERVLAAQIAVTQYFVLGCYADLELIAAEHAPKRVPN